MFALVNASPSKLLEVAASYFACALGHMIKKVLGNSLCDLGLKVKVIMYLLVNAFFLNLWTQ